MITDTDVSDLRARLRGQVTAVAAGVAVIGLVLLAA